MRFLRWLDPDPAAPQNGGDLPQLPHSGPAWEEILELARSRLAERRVSALREGAGELLRWNVARGADPGLEERWSALMAGRGLAVVTGQQPALLGGPLYSLYKLLSAIALAGRIERATGAPTLALFWVVGDDSDFGEVSSVWWPQQDGRILKLRDSETPPTGTLIGLLPADRQRGVLSGIPARDAVSAPAPESELPSALRRALEVGETWSGVQAALFYRLLDGLPFLVVDGAHPAVVRAQGPWIREALGWPLADDLRAGAEEARGRGFDPALDPELGERPAFRLRENRREPWSGTFEPTDSLVPNVVLRPLLQDFLLPNVATVCGPSEVRYRAQLGPLYRRAGVPEPARIPRLRATLLPPLGHAGAAEEDYIEAASRPDQYLEAVLRRVLPHDLVSRVDAVRARVRSELEDLRPHLADFDPSLPQVLDSSLGRVDFQLGRIREGIEAKARHQFYQRHPMLARLKEFVRPRDGEQERSLSLLTPFLSEGSQPRRHLLEAADQHLERILGRGLPPAGALFLLERFGAGTPGVRDDEGGEDA